jgi:hypothetical protein
MLLRMASTGLILVYAELPELSENVCPVSGSECGELLMECDGLAGGAGDRYGVHEATR